MEIKGKTGRKGELTIEMALATVLVVVVIFLSMGIFSNNLKAMLGNSNFNNLFHRQQSTEFDKTHISYENKDKQVYVQAIAEQGLTVAQYRQLAMDEIKRIANLTPPLSAKDRGDLARQLTIFGQSSVNNAIISGEPLPDNTGYQQRALENTSVPNDPNKLTYKQLADREDVKIKFNWSEQYTQIGSNIVQWSTTSDNNTNSEGATTDPLLNTLKAISTNLDFNN